MPITLNRNYVFLAFGAWLAAYILLSLTQFDPFHARTVIAFVTLLCLPGLLTILALRLTRLDVWGSIALTAGFSLLELMVVALIGNTILPFVGITRPLEAHILLGEVALLVSLLVVVNWICVSTLTISIGRYALFHTLRDALFAYTPIAFVLMSIIGATALNAQGSNIYILAMLISIALYSACLIGVSSRLGPNVIPTALFFISLSLLLMTSLRGDSITGHDIQREYNVFQLTQTNGRWSIEYLHDAYNACMSITILPTIFEHLTAINPPYIFKFLFQIIFAVVPSVVYLIAQRYLSAATALISTLYFIAFPTFFGDMPFLDRQEIAFLFLALMMYILFDEWTPLFKRRILFTFLGIGMVLSHYSTTYIVIALLIFVVAAEPVLRGIRRLFSKYAFVHSSAMAAWSAEAAGSKRRITLSMVVVLAVASFLWSSVLTDTSSNSVYRVIQETITVMRDATKEDARSSDVLYSLFSWKRFDPDTLLKEYEAKAIADAHEAPPGTFYMSAPSGRYPIVLAEEELLPLTPVGDALTASGIDVHAFNSGFRKISAKSLQLLLMIGFLAAIFTARFFKRPLDTEFALFGAGSLILLVAIIILPVLSVEYGLLRAFQQSLMFLGIFIVTGCFRLTSWTRESVRVGFAGALAVIFMLSSTGVITQSLGGYDPQLHLNNSGPYYDLYYVHDSELAATKWLAGKVEEDGAKGIQSEIQSDNNAVGASNLLSGANISHDINPVIVRKDAYVFLGVSNVLKQRATFSYNGTQITYTYPIQFLNENKKLIYDVDGVKIYR